MGDYYYGCLTIPTNHLDNENRKLLEEMGKVHGYLLEDLEEDQSGPFTVFSHNEARDGQFEEIEEDLVTLEIPFNRYSSGYDDYAPQRRYFRPGEAEPDRTIYLTSDDEEYIPHEQVKALLEIILDEDKGREDAVAVATRIVNEYTSEGIRLLETYVKDDENGS